jgi:hypothetical protein
VNRKEENTIEEKYETRRESKENKILKEKSR